jgi:hypothetical protein
MIDMQKYHEVTETFKFYIKIIIHLTYALLIKKDIYQYYFLEIGCNGNKM